MIEKTKLRKGTVFYSLITHPNKWKCHFSDSSHLRQTSTQDFPSCPSQHLNNYINLHHVWFDLICDNSVTTVYPTKKFLSNAHLKATYFPGRLLGFNFHFIPILKWHFAPLPFRLSSSDQRRHLPRLIHQNIVNW